MGNITHNPDASKFIDDYINSSPEFARPICYKLREIILKAEPGITEDWKWGPNYYKEGMVCGYGAFKQHVTLVFFKGSLMKDHEGILQEGGSNLRTRSVKFRKADDIKPKVLTSYIKEAVKLNESGTEVKDRQLDVPADMKILLNMNKDVKNIFEKLAYTHKKEYILWIEGAKKQETRERRLQKAIVMLRANRKEP